MEQLLKRYYVFVSKKKLSQKLEKVLNGKSDGAVKILKPVFCLFLKKKKKPTRAVNNKFGYKLEHSMLNSSAMSIFLSVLRANLHELHHCDHFYQSCKDTK